MYERKYSARVVKYYYVMAQKSFLKVHKQMSLFIINYYWCAYFLVRVSEFSTSHASHLY